jgi:hypothetical protein
VGMARAPPAADERPILAASMFGNTTPCSIARARRWSGWVTRCWCSCHRHRRADDGGADR